MQGFDNVLHAQIVRFEDVKPLENRKSAFTLAEVLITLGIIGVVAAMTIPMLMTNVKAHKLKSQFLKSYSTIQQAIKMMQYDDVSLDPATYSGKDNLFYKQYIKYFKGALDCGYFGAWGAGNKNTLPCYFTESSSLKKYKSLDGKQDVDKDWFDDGQILLQDGMLLLFDNAYGNFMISVDLNGYTTPPNRWGYDLFTFDIVDGGVKPMGAIGTQYYNQRDSYCDINSSDKHNGFTCAQKAIENADYFKWAVKNIK